jgi:phage gp37-like protein
MGSGIQLEEVYDALEALLDANLGGMKVNVQPFTSQSVSFEQDTFGKIIAQPPAVLLMLREASLDARNDHTATEYAMRAGFSAFIGAKALRSSDAERASALGLLTKVSNILAGARLSVPSAGNKLQVILERLGLAQLELDGTWYRLDFVVFGPCQFSGVAV